MAAAGGAEGGAEGGAVAFSTNGGGTLDDRLNAAAVSAAGSAGASSAPSAMPVTPLVLKTPRSMEKYNEEVRLETARQAEGDKGLDLASISAVTQKKDAFPSYSDVIGSTTNGRASSSMLAGLCATSWYANADAYARQSVWMSSKRTQPPSSTSACALWVEHFGCARYSPAHPGLAPASFEPLSTALLTHDVPTTCAEIWSTGRTVWFMGDSVASQLLRTSLCLCGAYTTHSGGTNESGPIAPNSTCFTIAAHGRLSALSCASRPPFTSPQYFQFAKFDCYRVGAGRACLASAAKPLQLAAVLTALLRVERQQGEENGGDVGHAEAPRAEAHDIIVANTGLHLSGAGFDKELATISLALARAAELGALRRRRHGAAPALFWRQSTPQHFPTADGSYPVPTPRTWATIANGSPNGCKATTGAALAATTHATAGRLAKDGLAKDAQVVSPQPLADRIDAIVRAPHAKSANGTGTAQASEWTLIPTWWPCSTRGADHTGTWRPENKRDCTHFCEGHARAALPPSQCLQTLARLILTYVRRAVVCGLGANAGADDGDMRADGARGDGAGADGDAGVDAEADAGAGAAAAHAAPHATRGDEGHPRSSTCGDTDRGQPSTQGFNHGRVNISQGGPSASARAIAVRSQPHSGSAWFAASITLLLTTICSTGQKDEGVRCECHEVGSGRSPHILNVSSHITGQQSLVELAAFDNAKHSTPVKLAPSLAGGAAAQLLRDSAQLKVLTDSAATTLLTRCIHANLSMWSSTCLRLVLPAWPPPLVCHTTFILLLRDPRSIALRMVPTNSTANSTTGTSPQLVSAAVSQAVAISLRYVLHMRLTTSTLPLFYEDLIDDPAKWLGVVAGYIGVPTPSADELARFLPLLSGTSSGVRGGSPTGAPSGHHGGARQGSSTALLQNVPLLLRVTVAAESSSVDDVGDDTRAELHRAVCPALVSPLRLRWLGSSASC